MKNTSQLLAFIFGAICGIAIFTIIENNRKQKIAELKNKINNGYANDYDSLISDAAHIRNDFNKSLNALS